VAAGCHRAAPELLLLLWCMADRMLIASHAALQG
jgi:hypothetical protein